MKVTKNSSKQDKPKPTRLYLNLISAIRLIGFIGYIGALIFSVFIAAEASSDVSGAWGFLILIVTFTPLLFSLYVVTQSSVAIIDLLSRIEFNSRQH